MKQKFMRAAIRLSIAMMRRGKGGPFGAVVVKGNRIVGRGCNQVTSGNDPTAHAEIVAIRDACRRLKTFQLGECERLKRVYYANTRRDAAKIQFDDDFIYHQVRRPISKRRLVMKQLLRSEALLAFREWATKTDKIPY
jgi:tRNA(Arg) A34 adenosine deaminase TadA